MGTLYQGLEQRRGTGGDSIIATEHISKCPIGTLGDIGKRGAQRGPLQDPIRVPSFKVDRLMRWEGRATTTRRFSERSLSGGEQRRAKTSRRASGG
jgi:hypothetical protein